MEDRFSHQLPTTMTIADRTYYLVDFLKEGEISVNGDVMVARAKEVSAHLGRDDAHHILKHQDEIPILLQGRVVFAFTDWRISSNEICCVRWEGDKWGGSYDFVSSNWGVHIRLLRRK